MGRECYSCALHPWKVCNGSKRLEIQLNNYCQNNSSDCQRIPQGLKPAGFQQGTNDYKNIPHSQSFVQYIWDLLNYPPTDLTVPFTCWALPIFAGPENLPDKRSRVLKLTPDDSWGLLMGFWQDLVGTTKRKNKLCPYELFLQACTLFENCWNQAVLKFSLLWFGISRFF